MNAHILTYLRTIYKIIFAGLGLWALGNEIGTLQARGTFNGGNFFSFFTVQSNLFAAVMFLVGAYALMTRLHSQAADALRGAATLYMGMTGIIFAILLSGLDPTVLTAVPIDNAILHYIIPVAAAVDWLIDPPKGIIRIRTAWLWLIYPLLYIIYTLVRGTVTHWYPYPFVNLDKNGIGAVLVSCLIITVGVIAGGFAVRLWSWFVHRKSA